MTIRKGNNIIAGAAKSSNLTTVISNGGFEVGDIGISLFVEERKGLRRYLNGSILVIKPSVNHFLTKLRAAAEKYPSLLCTEQEWQEIAAKSPFGQCGKFVIDEEYQTIRLPKICTAIQGLTDLSKLAEMTKQELPNVTGHIRVINEWDMDNSSIYNKINGAMQIMEFPAAASGLVHQYTPSGSKNSSYPDGIWDVEFKSSNSNPIYDGDKIQPEGVKYPYFIQIASGNQDLVEDEIANINQVSFTNPFVLLENKYSTTKMNNASWLASEGQWNDGNVYEAAYEKLLKEYNNVTNDMEVKKNYATSKPLKDENGVLSGFSRYAYARLLNKFSFANDWEVQIKFTHKIASHNQYYICGTNEYQSIALTAGTDNKLSLHGFDDTSLTRTTAIYQMTSNIALQNGQTYWARCKYSHTDGYLLLLSTDGETFNIVASSAVKDKVIPDTIGFGIDYAAGEATITDSQVEGVIDFNECYVKDKSVIWWKPFAKQIKHVKECYTDMDFVLDTENRKFRLPLYNGSENILDEDNAVDLYAQGKLMTASQYYTYVAPSNGYLYMAIRNGMSSNAANYLGILNSKSYGTCEQWAYGTNNIVIVGPLFFKAGQGISDMRTTCTNGTERTIKFFKAKGEGKLYYYVGETLQDAHLVNVGRISEQLTDMNGAMESIYDNVKETLAKFNGHSFPSNRFVNLTLGSSGTQYTAPANGWFVLAKGTRAISQYVELYNNANALRTIGNTENSSDQIISCYIPAQKGQVISAYYNASGTLNVFRFVYAEGEY